MNNMKKVFAVIMAMAMIFALSISASATTANYLVDYYGQYTYPTDYGNGGYHFLLAAPDYDPAGFATADEAALNWSIISGSISGVQIVTSYPLQMDESHYVAVAEVSVATSAPVGPASIMAMDTSGAYVNFTIVVDYAQGTGSENNILCKYYNVTSANSETLLTTVSNLSPAWNTHYGDTKFTSAMDAGIAAYFASDAITSVFVDNSIGTMPYYVRDMTINGIPYNAYTDQDYNYFGWQYRVYRNNTLLPITEYVGADQFKLNSGDTIVWKFGQYGVISFSGTLN